MYHTVLETIAKIIYARRIRHVGKVGRAAKMAKEGRQDEALAYLIEIEKKIHPKVRSILSFTRAKILDEMGREKEAEAEMIAAAKLDPSHFRAHLELARMSGRCFQFKNAKARFLELSTIGDETIREQAQKHLLELEDIASGKAAAKMTERATKIAAMPLGPAQHVVGLPADLQVLNQFLKTSPDQPAEILEDLALLLGETAVMFGGTWQISLSLRHSYVSFEAAPSFYPFEAVAYRLIGGDISILKFPPSHSK